MNWLQNSTLAVLIAISLFACKSGVELGGEISPVEKLGAYYKDNFNLKTTIINFDSINTNGSYRLLVGNHFDPVFGNVLANAYTKFVIGTLRENLGPNPAADSIYIEFTIGEEIRSVGKIKPYFYGGDKKVKLKLYQLSSLINTDTTLYYRKNSVGYNPSHFLGEVEIDNSVLNSTITSRIIKARLHDSLANYFVKNQDKFSSEASFQEIFKGLAFISDPLNEAVVGITDIQLVLYYHNFYGLNNIKSNEIASIFASFRYNPKDGQNQFLINRSMGELKNLEETLYDSVSTTELADKCYIQPNVGVFTKVAFFDLESFKETVKLTTNRSKVLVNKAELVIYPDTNENYLFPEQLYAFELTNNNRIKLTEAGQFQYLQNELSGIFGSRTSLTASYDVTNKVYKFPITAYLQALIDGTKENKGLLLGIPNSLYDGSQYGSLNRLTFKNGLKSEGKNNIQLKVYYTPY